MRIRNSIISALLFLITALSVVLCGCANEKIAIGKYYVENNTESYIEILEDNQIVFVNVDFSGIQLDAAGSSMTVAEIAEKLSQPQEYEYYKGSSIEGYDYTLQVLFDGNKQDGGICLTLRWSKSKTLWCLNNVYVLAN